MRLKARARSPISSWRDRCNRTAQVAASEPFDHPSQISKRRGQVDGQQVAEHRDQERQPEKVLQRVPRIEPRRRRDHVDQAIVTVVRDANPDRSGRSGAKAATAGSGRGPVSSPAAAERSSPVTRSIPRPSVRKNSDSE